MKTLIYNVINQSLEKITLPSSEFKLNIDVISNALKKLTETSIDNVSFISYSGDDLALPRALIHYFQNIFWRRAYEYYIDIKTVDKTDELDKMLNTYNALTYSSKRTRPINKVLNCIDIFDTYLHNCNMYTHYSRQVLFNINNNKKGCDSLILPYTADSVEKYITLSNNSSNVLSSVLNLDDYHFIMKNNTVYNIDTTYFKFVKRDDAGLYFNDDIDGCKPSYDNNILNLDFLYDVKKLKNSISLSSFKTNISNLLDEFKNVYTLYYGYSDFNQNKQKYTYYPSTIFSISEFLNKLQFPKSIAFNLGQHHKAYIDFTITTLDYCGSPIVYNQNKQYLEGYPNDVTSKNTDFHKIIHDNYTIITAKNFSSVESYISLDKSSDVYNMDKYGEKSVFNCLNSGDIKKSAYNTLKEIINVDYNWIKWLRNYCFYITTTNMKMIDIKIQKLYRKLIRERKKQMIHVVFDKYIIVSNKLISASLILCNNIILQSYITAVSRSLSIDIKHRESPFNNILDQKCALAKEYNLFNLDKSDFPWLKSLPFKKQVDYAQNVIDGYIYYTYMQSNSVSTMFITPKNFNIIKTKNDVNGKEYLKQCYISNDEYFRKNHEPNELIYVK